MRFNRRCFLRNIHPRPPPAKSRHAGNCVPMPVKTPAHHPLLRKLCFAEALNKHTSPSNPVTSPVIRCRSLTAPDVQGIASEHIRLIIITNILRRLYRVGFALPVPDCYFYLLSKRALQRGWGDRRDNDARGDRSGSERVSGNFHSCIRQMEFRSVNPHSTHRG